MDGSKGFLMNVSQTTLRAVIDQNCLGELKKVGLLDMAKRGEIELRSTPANYVDAKVGADFPKVNDLEMLKAPGVQGADSTGPTTFWDYCHLVSDEEGDVYRELWEELSELFFKHSWEELVTRKETQGARNVFAVSVALYHNVDLFITHEKKLLEGGVEITALGHQLRIVTPREAVAEVERRKFDQRDQRRGRRTLRPRWRTLARTLRGRTKVAWKFVARKQEGTRE